MQKTNHSTQKSQQGENKSTHRPERWLFGLIRSQGPERRRGLEAARAASTPRLLSGPWLRISPHSRRFGLCAGCSVAVFPFFKKMAEASASRARWGGTADELCNVLTIASNGEKTFCRYDESEQVKKSKVAGDEGNQSLNCDV